ncbi:MAG: amino acid permease [Planctomycetia bacterium]|jgi:amino acid transporter
MNMKLTRQLSLFDSICLIVSVTIGVGIYEFLPNIAQGSPGWCPDLTWLLGIWVVGGFFSLCGALGYAELSSAMPESGGDYVYLNRAYGSWAGFLFGWILTLVVRPGDIAIMAFVFARYLYEIFQPFHGTNLEPYTTKIFAAGIVALLTVVHIVGVREGKWTNNVLSVVKIFGLILIVVVAFVAPVIHGGTATAVQEPMKDVPPPAIAMLFVLLCFGGWNEVAYVAAEVKNPKRNLVRSLVLGIGLVTLLYLLLVLGIWYSLGFVGITQSKAVATDVVGTLFPVVGTRLIAAFICISAMGAVSGMVFAGARVSFALGQEHKTFSPLKIVQTKRRTPVNALMVQGLIACVLIFCLGSPIKTIILTSPVLYLFFCATSLAVIVLRFREPGLPRPYRATFYPFPMLIFIIVCGFLLYETICYDPVIAACGYGIMLLGLVAWAVEYIIAKKRAE